MKAFSVAPALALVATLARAAPSPPIQARQGVTGANAALLFEGAGPNPPSYTVDVEATAQGTPFTIDNPLSVSHITLSAGGVNLAGCTVFGAEGSEVLVPDASSRDVGPPQPQVSGTCVSFQ
ncbi:hypothetical protein ACLMJK_005588 [Lecanora helva]